jgi:Transposase DDE domain
MWSMTSPSGAASWLLSGIFLKCEHLARLRKKIEILFAHLKRILKLDRLRLRGPNGARDEFLLAATAQNLRKLAKLIPLPNLKPA